MRIAVITPSYPPSIGGNATTASRLVEGLKPRKIRTMVFLPEQLKKRSGISRLKRFKPDLVHAFHAYKSGIIGMKICKKLGIPLILTITGTDVNINMFDGGKRKKTMQILNFAKAIVVFHKTMKEKIVKEIPNLKSKIKIIKQTVRLKHKHCEIRKELKLKKNDFVFFLPAALRLIKYKKFFLGEFAKLNEKYNIKLILAGPVLEEDFANRLFQEIKNYGWVHYLPKIPHDKIKCVYEEIDVSLNTSITEGGMSNAVLEAMSMGKPVLASAIDGNMSVIKNGYNGLIFKDGDEFYRKAEQLILSRNMRQKIGNNAKSFIKKNFHYKDEISGYAKAYRELLN